jgi:transposase
MPKPYSADLRERVLLADAAGLSPAVVAARFGVGLSTVLPMAPAGARGGAALCQDAWRRAGAGD